MRALLLLLLLGCALSGAHGYATFYRYYDSSCGNKYVQDFFIGSTDTAGSTCVPLLGTIIGASGTPTATDVEHIAGFKGAAYAKVYCPTGASSNAVPASIWFYSDSGCTAGGLLAVREQLAPASEEKCRDGVKFSCSAGSASVPTMPAGFAKVTSCDDDATCAKDCATEYWPANRCVEVDTMGAAAAQSRALYCNNTADLNNAHGVAFSASGCPAGFGSLLQHIAQPNGSCHEGLTLTCPAAPVDPSPTPFPQMPTVSAGFVMTVGGCDSTACSSGCRRTAYKAGSCMPLPAAIKSLGQESFCSGPRNTAQDLFQVRYSDGTCSASNAELGAVFPRDTDCTGRHGTVECDPSGATGAVPAVFTQTSAFYTYSGTTCDAADSTPLVLKSGECVSTDGVSSWKLTCPSDSGKAKLELFYLDVNCAKTATLSATTADQTCGAFSSTSIAFKPVCNYTVTAAGVEIGLPIPDSAPPRAAFSLVAVALAIILAVSLA